MPEPSPKRILVVDDEEVVRSLCARVLSPLGYWVETASDGHQALTYFEKEPYDLLITDYRMPGDMNGQELAQAVKKLRPATQIILMTAFPAVDTAVEMLRIGARDYLVKPFDQVELMNCVKSCFGNFQPA